MPNFVDELKLDGNPIIDAISFSASVDSQTVKLGRYPFKGEIVAVSFATGGALGAGLGIDVKNGSDTVVSCTDNLNGYELKTSMANAGITSSSDLSIVFDDYSAPIWCSVIIYIKRTS